MAVLLRYLLLLLGISSRFHSGLAVPRDRLHMLQQLQDKFLYIAQYFVDVENQELESLTKFYNRAKELNDFAMQDPEDYAGDPISAFQLIRRFAMDWPRMHQIIENGAARVGSEVTLNQLREQFTPPNSNDMLGAINGVIKHQIQKHLSASAIANGAVNGSTLTWHQCFLIGSTLVDEQRLQLGKEWLKTSLKLLDKESSLKPADQPLYNQYYIHIYEYLGIAYDGLGMPEKASNNLEKILNLEPEHMAKEYLRLLDKDEWTSGPVHSRDVDEKEECSNKIELKNNNIKKEL